jgi:hypothetical protein
MTEQAVVIAGGGPTGLMLAGEPLLEQQGRWGSGETLRQSLESA